MKTAYINTPIGILEAKGDGEGLVSVLFGDFYETNVSKKVPKELKHAVAQLQEYFEGKRQDFSLKLSPEGTDFQKRVWKQLQ